MKQDEVIKKKVSEILFNNMENADQGINIEVENGFVKLSGIVDILSEKNYAEDMARTIEGVKGVDNSLSISMDGNIDDSDITRTVIDRILSHPGLKEAGLGAETKKGTVYLMGTVKALDDSNTARDIAGTVIGVKEIVNLIKIKRM
jgi:osmotically-inducible protein OsmY